MEHNGRVLVACPTYAGKEYCLDQWVDAFHALDWPEDDKFPLLVDNTRGSDGYAKLILSKDVRVIHIDPSLTFEETFRRCWQYIHQEAVIEGFDWVFSVEQDNIVPPDALKKLMHIAEAGNMEVVTHTYPMHLREQARNGRTPWMNKSRFVYNELGCCLLSTRLLGLGLAHHTRYPNFTVGLFQCASRFLTGWATACKLFDVEHLDGYYMEYNQYLARADDGRVNPYEGMEMPEVEHVLPKSVAADVKKIGKVLEPGTYKAEGSPTVLKDGNGEIQLSLDDLELMAVGEGHVVKE